jgi:hypothetical protein
LHKEKYYVANIISTVVLMSIWLIRNDFIFNRQVWLDVKFILRKMMKLCVEWKLICVEDDRDDEVVVFPGGADQRAVEDNKFLNLSKTIVMTHLLMLGSAV